MSDCNINVDMLNAGALPAQPIAPPTPAPPAPPAAPTTASGIDCAGAPFSATGVGVVQSVPHPTAVQLVKLCPAPATAQDREFVLLCAPDGTKVAVQNVTLQDAPLGTAPTFEAYLLDGFPYFGDVAELTDCGSEKVDIAQAITVCKDGAEFTRTDFWDVFSSPRALLGSVWQNALGSVVAAPASPFATGKCDARLHANPVHWCEAGVCIEGKAWYSEQTGQIVRVNKLDGTASTIAASEIKEGACPPVSIREHERFYGAADACRKITVRETTSACGATTYAAFEADFTPIAGFDVLQIVDECQECKPLLPVGVVGTWG